MSAMWVFKTCHFIYIKPEFEISFYSWSLLLFIYLFVLSHRFWYVGSLLKEFLKCINGEFTDSNFSAILEKEVKRIKDSKKWRKEYMYMELLLRDERREARKQGVAEGKAEGSKLINSLHKKLIEDGRMEELEKSVVDEEYQQSLLKEYSLI